MIDVTKDTSQRSNEMDKRCTYELLKEYNNLFPALEEEVIGLEFLLAESSCCHGSVEPFLGVSSANLQKCFGTDNEQDHKNISSKTSFHTLRRGEQYHWEDKNGLNQSTDEGILQEMNNLPSICEEYLFDCKLTGDVSTLDSDSSKIPFINQLSEFTSENVKECSDSEGHYCNCSAEMVNESTMVYGNLAAEAGRLCHSPASLLNKKLEPEIITRGKKTLLCDSMVTFASVVNDFSLHLTDNDACFAHKRSRKRPQRYIDEYSKYHSVLINKRSGCPSKNTREKTARTPYLDCMKDVKEKTWVHYNEYIIEPIQVPFGHSMLKKCSKERGSLSPDYGLEVCNKAIINFSEESTNTELSLNPSQDDRSDDYDLGEVTKDQSGRKHNRYWAEYEIAKLIEGVATFGVGRWTEIKRGLFPPTTRRSSVDLKDKWRNLLKACRARVHGTTKGRRTAHQQVPQSVLRQVKELAVMYPYPKIPNRKNALVVRY